MRRILGLVAVLTSGVGGFLAWDRAAYDESRADEYRAIFEKSYRNWLEIVGRASYCFVPGPDEDEIAAITGSAATAFYPGVWNYWRRAEYRLALLEAASESQFSGRQTARQEGCFQERTLLAATRVPVDEGIRAAEDLW